MSEPSDSPRDNLSLIVAMSENNVIGRNGEMPWHISADLRRFKQLTMGHFIVMGRKTFDSIGRCLPGRKSVIITRQSDLVFSGANADESLFVSNSLDAALSLVADDSEAFVIGGGQIYSTALPRATRVYLTRVHTTIPDGDTFFPELDWSQWKLTSREQHESDQRNEFDYTFENYQRMSQ